MELSTASEFEADIEGFEWSHLFGRAACKESHDTDSTGTAALCFFGRQTGLSCSRFVVSAWLLMFHNWFCAIATTRPAEKQIGRMWNSSVYSRHTAAAQSARNNIIPTHARLALNWNTQNWPLVALYLGWRYNWDKYGKGLQPVYVGGLYPDPAHTAQWLCFGGECMLIRPSKVVSLTPLWILLNKYFSRPHHAVHVLKGNRSRGINFHWPNQCSCYFIIYSCPLQQSMSYVCIK